MDIYIFLLYWRTTEAKNQNVREMMYNFKLNANDRYIKINNF